MHIAVVWDAVNGERIYYQNGKQVAYSNQKMSGSVTLTSNCYVGKSYNEERYIPGEISELRVWSVARTPEQIAGNMYGVSPESEGAGGLLEIQRGFRFDDHRPCERHESLCRGRHADLDSRNSS